MSETAFDLGDAGNFFNGITADITSAYKAFNQPSNVPVAGAAVPGRPGYVYGPGGSILAVNPATGGALPPVNSIVTSGASISTVLLIAGVGILGVAFLLSLKK